MRTQWLPLAGLLAGLFIAASQYLIWFYAPVEQTLGPIQKIFYVHMPLAWWALISFFVVFVASALFLWKRLPVWDHLAGAAAELGVLFSGLALVSGSIWAKVSWNVWWTWDPRLSTTLIMWFIYSGYLVLRSMDMNPRRRAVACAVVGIVAFVDVPLVFYSARLWRSIHPAVLAAKGGGLEPEMLRTLFASIAAFALLWLAMLGCRTRQLSARARLDALAGQAQEL